ncbi:MAG: ABC transporter permease, partial [bacterium]|nr:ABC transporter permease [bacterium]
IIKGADELPCLGVAIQPEIDPGLFNIKESLLEGEWLEPGDDKILVGKDLAEDTEISVGDIVTVRMITSSDKDDFSWNAVDMEVKGIFESGNPTVDGGRIILPLATAMESLGLENEVTEIVVRLDNDDDNTILTAQNRINEILMSREEKFEVVTWKDLAGAFLAISEMKTQRSGMIVTIMLIIASMGIINTMLMAVFERTREIGMLAALGMKKAEIMKLFIFEGGFIGAIGALLGCILGGLVAWYLEVEGMSMAAFGETFKKLSEAAYPIKDVYYADLTMDVLVMVFLFGVGISVLAAAYPAWKAAKLNPTEALRHI